VVEMLLCLSTGMFLLNAYILYNNKFPGSCNQRGCNFLSFHLKVANQLISTTKAKQKAAGRPISEDHQGIDRFNVELGHWPMHAENKMECIVKPDKAGDAS